MRDGQVEPGVGDGDPAGEVRVHVVGAEADARPPPEDRDEQGEAVRVEPDGRAPRRAVAGRGDERLDLDEERPAALQRRRDDAPGRGTSCSTRNARAGSATSRRPASTISRTPTSSVAPNRFFEARTQPERAAALALDGDDRVDEVLQRLGPGDAPLLRHVADEDDRDPLPLRQLHQAQGRLADLADAAGRAVELVERRRLDRVDDDRRRAHRPCRLDDPGRRRGRRGSGRRRPPARRAGRGGRRAGGPARRTPRRVAYRTGRPLGGEPGGGLQQERRLPDAGLAADEHERAGDQAAAEDPVQLGEADREARARPRRPSAARGTGCAADGPPRRDAARPPRHVANDGLDEGVPRAAGAALALPAKEGLAAGLADVAALRAAPRRLDGLDDGGRLLVGSLDREAGLLALVHDDRGAGLVAPEQEVLGEDVLDHVLDDAAQRPGAVGDVVARS